MTLKEKIGIATKLIRKSMELKYTAGHDVFVEWGAHVEWITVRAFTGPWNQDKTSKDFTIEFKYASCAKKIYKEAMQYLDNMGKTSEAEAQNG